MEFYLAPLEGITTYIYRNTYAKHFGQVDKYFTPFIVPHIEKKLSTREKKELLAEHNQNLPVVPQLLTNNAEDFFKTTGDFQGFGHKEINLNFGCPSKTVVSKKRGSGFLAYPDAVDAFLEEIFSKSNMEISIKTRIGKENPEEFYRLLEIYNKYPLKELIIHPRVQQDFYKNSPNWDIFQAAYEECKSPLCYNGDINTVADYERLMERFPKLEKVMLGRGIIRNPGLISQITGENLLTKERLQAFHDDIMHAYKDISFGDKNLLFKMKELWCYMLDLFEDAEKLGKKIRKCQHLAEYELIVKELFLTKDIKTF